MAVLGGSEFGVSAGCEKGSGVYIEDCRGASSARGSEEGRQGTFLIAVHCDITQWYMTSSHGYKSKHLSIHA